jgi:hypothetical protein
MSNPNSSKENYQERAFWLPLVKEGVVLRPLLIEAVTISFGHSGGRRKGYPRNPTPRARKVFDETPARPLHSFPCPATPQPPDAYPHLCKNTLAERHPSRDWRFEREIEPGRRD